VAGWLLPPGGEAEDDDEASQTDAEIQQAVLRELERDPRVGPTEVGIEVDEGVVTLTGMGQARYAERIASRVDVAAQDGKATLAGRVGSWSEKEAVLDGARSAAGIEIVEDQLVVDPMSERDVPPDRRRGLLWEGLAATPEQCAACGAPLRSQEVPAVDDGPAWAARGREHRPGCEWVRRRGCHPRAQRQPG
jgi:hypothetical protein